MPARRFCVNTYMNTVCCAESKSDLTVFLHSQIFFGLFKTLFCYNEKDWEVASYLFQHPRCIILENHPIQLVSQQFQTHRC
ncbi:uncharacterized protein Dvar_76520 [Desulfosarcina variabilis str. Montpellier]